MNSSLTSQPGSPAVTRPKQDRRFLSALARLGQSGRPSCLQAGFLWTVKSAEAFEVSTATVDVSSRDSVHALVETATPCSSILLEVNMDK